MLVKNLRTCIVLAALSIALCGDGRAEGLRPQVAVPTSGIVPRDAIVFSISAAERGADLTGREDATEILQRALDELKSKGGGTLFLPAGRYRLEKSLRIDGGVALRGEWAKPGSTAGTNGTILCVFGGRGEEGPEKGAAIHVQSGACLRDVTIWHPEQRVSNPVPYPAAICGHGHASVVEVTLVNSWCGYYNNDCSSMLIRDLYATCLKLGIHGAYAYDIPRIEHVKFDTAYWARSGLAGAPYGASLRALNRFCEENLVCISAGEQDWGYWWDIEVNHAKWGIHLTAVLDNAGRKMVPGNIGAGQVKMQNVTTGVRMENVGYPGFLLTFGDISARDACFHYAKRPDYSAFEEDGVRPAYYKNATIVLSNLRLADAATLFRSEKDEGFYGVNFNACSFENWKRAAIALPVGSLTASNCKFLGRSGAIVSGEKVDQIVLTGNSFRGAVFAAKPAASTVLARDDGERRIPVAKYSFSYAVDERPARNKLYDVTEFGAVAGTLDDVPNEDSTHAIQRALDAAGREGGGVVYVPAGAYRMNGGVRVPTGVELRGSFESQHYGNSTSRGTHLLAYGDKGNAKGTPLVTLSKRSAVSGFSVFYPGQRYTDRTDDESLKCHPYPPTVRTAPGAQVRNMTITGAWVAVDAMTVRSDGFVLTDVTGAALRSALELGHGTVGGLVRDFHFNYSCWTQQGKYPSHPSGENDKLLGDYTTRCTRGIVLGDAKNVAFHSCFNIIVAEQIVLVKDPYTGGDFVGRMWGVAFDAAANGIIGTRGSKARLAILGSMGVFFPQGGGYYVKTEPDFEGRIVLYNADEWSGASKTAYVGGGSVRLVQFFPWCCHDAVVKKGGELQLLGSTIVSDNNRDGKRTTCTFEPGSKGLVVGTLDCRKALRIVDETNGGVQKRNNGVEAKTPDGHS